MTDNEIIKWLEGMSNKYPNGFSTETLTLINRQKAEIERLQKEANLVSIQFQDLQERINDIKTDAYKELAERLKEKYFDIVLYGKIVTVNAIDNLLKEMVGEEE